MNRRRLIVLVAGFAILAAQNAGLAGPRTGTDLAAQRKVVTNVCSVNGTVKTPDGANDPLTLTKVCSLKYQGPVFFVTGTADGQEGFNRVNCPIDSPPACSLANLINSAMSGLLGSRGAYLTLRATLMYGPTFDPQVLARCEISARSLVGYANTYADYNVRCAKTTQKGPLPSGSPLSCILEVSSPKASAISGLAMCASLPTARLR